MTLIFSCCPLDTPPFLVADCLISNVHQAGEDNGMQLPSGQNEEAMYVGAVELCKKLYVLHPHLAIAWADSKIEAKVFLREARELCCNVNEITMDLLNQIKVLFNEYSQLNVIVSAYIQSTESFFSLNLKCKEKIFPRINKTIYEGTGSVYLENNRLNLSDPESIELEGRNQLTSDELNECRAISLAANIFINECISTENLQNYYGGMFDFCYFSREHNSFIYTDSIFIHFWAVLHKEHPPYQFYYGYFRGENELEQRKFSFYESKIKNNALVIHEYKCGRKTQKGHIVKKTIHTVEKLVDSIYPKNTLKRNISINTYYFCNLTGITKRRVEIDVCDKKWISLIPYSSNSYEMIIHPRALKKSKETVKELANSPNILFTN